MVSTPPPLPTMFTPRPHILHEVSSPKVHLQAFECFTACWAVLWPPTAGLGLSILASPLAHRQLISQGGICRCEVVILVADFICWPLGRGQRAYIRETMHSALNLLCTIREQLIAAARGLASQPKVLAMATNCSAT